MAQYWHTSIAEAKLQIAILRDDLGGFEEMIKYYDRILEGRVGRHPFLNEEKNDRYILASGQSQETCRDLVHAQFAQGSLLQIPEMAWHQGYDLYDKYQDLLVNTMEYHAPLVMGEPLIPETMFLSNLLLAPPPGTIEFGDKEFFPRVLRWIFKIELNLVNPVLHAIKGHTTSGATDVHNGFDFVKNHVRREVIKILCFLISPNCHLLSLATKSITFLI